MPYRRLPNTDQARIRALKAVVAKGDTYNVYDLAVSLKVLTDARNFLVKFEAAHSYYVECFERQSKAGRKHQANVKTARLYISHFIQVLNLAVIRSEVRIAHKEYYGLDTSNNNVPDLSTVLALTAVVPKVVISCIVNAITSVKVVVKTFLAKAERFILSFRFGNLLLLLISFSVNIFHIIP